MSYTELLIGCGSNRDKKLKPPGHEEWANLTTLDNNREHKPDWVGDLLIPPFKPYDMEGYFIFSEDQYKLVGCPIPDNSFDEIHAYEVLEHTGAQGDYEFFFAQFEEFWRILKPGGLLCATVPSWRSEWAWGDPSHTRVITPGTLAFLSQKEYVSQVGKTAMSDFRYLYKADFDILHSICDDVSHVFVLRAVK